MHIDQEEAYSSISVNRVISIFIDTLADEHDLDESECEESLLDVEDFTCVLYCYWVTNVNCFPEERHWVRLDAYTGQRPNPSHG